MSWLGYGSASGSGDKDRKVQGHDPFLSNSGEAQVSSSSNWWPDWASTPSAPQALNGGEPNGAGQKSAEVIAKGGQTKPAADRDRVYRERVLVRVYHLNKTMITRALNSNLKSYGAFHTGVEVYGREWSFGMTFDDWSTGITWNPPGENRDHTFCETLSMGYTTMSPTQVWQLIEEMKTAWRGCTYHLLSRNCHHFSDTFCQRLGVNRIPTWLNDLAGTGAATVEFLDTSDSGYDNGEALFDFFSGMKQSIGDALGFEPEPAPVRKPRPPPRVKQELPPDRAEARHDPFSALR